MTDDKHNDSELSAYLDGRDGVSAAYRREAREEPPAVLDSIILAAARTAVKPLPVVSSGERRHLRGPYALAASVMAGVLATSLYFSQSELPATTSTVVEQKVVNESELQQEPAQAQQGARVKSEPAAAPLQPELLDEQAQVAKQRELDVARQTQQESESRREADLDFAVRALPPPQPTVSADNPPSAAVAAEAPAAPANARAAAGENRTVIRGPLLEQIERTAGTGALPAQEAAPTQLEEIQVTGSRVRSRDDIDRSYRDSQEEWLTVMREMTDDLGDLRQTLAERNEYLQLRDQLNEEKQLFVDEYPDVDLEAALAAPQQ